MKSAVTMCIRILLQLTVAIKLLRQFHCCSTEVFGVGFFCGVADTGTKIS